jgi:hypothetical protein
MPTVIAEIEMERDPQAERQLVALAAASEGLAEMVDGELVVDPIVEDLNAFADDRAHPGGVKLRERSGDRSLIEEAAEEIADLRSYLVWKALEMDRAAGDQERPEDWIRIMTALGHCVSAWAALTRPPSLR